MENYYGMLKKLLLLLAFAVYANFIFAQQRAISGQVTDSGDGSPIPGVNVAVKGTSVGTITDFDGKFNVQASNTDILVFSYMGYTSQEIAIGSNNTLSVALVASELGLDEVVVIGYGQVKKEDATGSVSAISTKDFNQGAITSPTELMTGKIAGVQITSGGGAPGDGSTIRIRGGSSLSASNDPLIVIDGVPIDNGTISGMRNPLNTINPNDIETFTVLKDASATAIYGSRASNGVIIITTKKGKEGSKLKLSYNANFSLSTLTKNIEVLDGDEFRVFITKRFGSGSNAEKLLGTANTNWQNEIYQNAFGHDHNISATGAYKKLPYRVSIGYSDQEGVLKTDHLQRTTGAVGLNPKFLEDHLQVNLNTKFMHINQRFANSGAIGSAVTFDPSQPVYSSNKKYAGYWAWLQPNGDPVTVATTNPVAQLMLQDDEAKVNRFIGNLELDYKFHFLPELRLNVNAAYDYSKSDGYLLNPATASWQYSVGGNSKTYGQEKKNELIDVYLNYVKELKSIDSKVDVMAGHSYQHFYMSDNSVTLNFLETDTITPASNTPKEYYLESLFGRINYSLKNRYLLTLTVREDISTKFDKGNRAGIFPSAAFAWKMKEESFLSGINAISDLRLRLGYGVTGQQDVVDNWYPYLASYKISTNTAKYQFGNSFINTLRPTGYNPSIKWEETTTVNAGLDYGFLKNRITGSIDWYKKTTTNLINFAPYPIGTNFSNEGFQNVGSMENKGVEFSTNMHILNKKDLSWQFGFNFTYNENKITKITAVDNPSYQGYPTGDMGGGVGNKIQIHSVNFAASSFFVYEQVYDSQGKSIEGLYVDRNGDGQITIDDKYHFKKPAPDVFLGISSKLSYKNFDFSFAGRANIGNYAYNNIASDLGRYTDVYRSGCLQNVPAMVTKTNFENAQYWSDYYIENASFFRMDYMALAYNIVKEKIPNIRVSATVQNAFVITKYTGLDPEISNGIDNKLYPRPTIFLLGLNIEF
jgi:TonB-dependent starch-binding outer membrane protein SusC